MSDITFVTVTSPNDRKGCQVKARHVGRNQYKLLGMPTCSGAIHQMDTVEAVSVMGHKNPVVTQVVQSGPYVTYAIDYRRTGNRVRFVDYLLGLFDRSSEWNDGEVSNFKDDRESGFAYVSVARTAAGRVMRDIKELYPDVVIYPPGQEYRSAYPPAAPRSRNPLGFTDPGVRRLFPWMA